MEVVIVLIEVTAIGVYFVGHGQDIFDARDFEIGNGCADGVQFISWDPRHEDGLHLCRRDGELQVIELPDFQLFAYVEDGCRIVEIEDGIGMIVFIIIRRIFAVSRDKVVDSLVDRSVPAGALDGLGLS